MTEARPEYSTPQMVALDLEVTVREILENAFGWVAIDAILFKIPAEQRNKAEVEKLLFALADRNVVRLNIRDGRGMLVELIKAGYKPTAEVLPDPAPRVRASASPQLTGWRRPPGALRLPPTPLPPETIVPDNTEAAILKIVREGPIRIGALAERVKVSGATCRYHLVRLAKEGKVEQADAANRMSAWQVPGAKAASVAPAASPRNGHKRTIPTTRKSGIDDLALKLQTLEACAEAAKADGRSIVVFILGEIRADLARLAA